MSKRKIRLEEVTAFVFEHDVTLDGRLKKKYQVHLGRKSARNGPMVAHACNMAGDVRWVYAFNPFMMKTLPICATCLHKTIMSLDDVSKGLLRMLYAPASNTGVN